MFTHNILAGSTYGNSLQLAELARKMPAGVFEGQHMSIARSVRLMDVWFRGEVGCARCKSCQRVCVGNSYLCTCNMGLGCPPLDSNRIYALGTGLEMHPAEVRLACAECIGLSGRQGSKIPRQGTAQRKYMRVPGVRRIYLTYAETYRGSIFLASD